MIHKVCPVCHSDRVSGDFFFIMGTYRCQDCGYEGPFIIEMDDESYRSLLEDDRRGQKT
ncbi:hypothetical protein GCM10007108_06010 [Thermogymnomonas acidicola]|uniref:Uncharacterized protein n=1 Tax=Thermogymnomonas acidicola TaxID=399579 RepID=A0AA37BQI5_9ARCH|nr:hypothetical protein GCM10007108_06010 [Thermogymnomonas acidicola]